jgi:hypothetical protein
MTNYVKSTNFATKDNLASGDPLKIVKGTEINTEYDNIAIAVATKADTASPTFTGTTTIPTVAISAGTITGITDLAVADGGTGASTATDARTNLSAAKSGANSDITSITGLTTALTVAQGGTGAATLTANNVVLGNGTSAVQFVAPGSSGNVLVSNGTTWASGSAGVTSAVAGTGIAVSSATGAVTISTAAPSFDAIGSYVSGAIKCTENNTVTFSSGGSLTAGSGNGQVGSAHSSGTFTNNLTGTWRWMGAPGSISAGGGDTAFAYSLLVKIS